VRISGGRRVRLPPATRRAVQPLPTQAAILLLGAAPLRRWPQVSWRYGGDPDRVRSAELTTLDDVDCTAPIFDA
jgi:hypothetical protein